MTPYFSDVSFGRTAILQIDDNILLLILILPLCRRYVYWKTAAAATAATVVDMWCTGERQGEEGEEEEETRGIMIE